MAVRAHEPFVPAWQRGKVASWLVTVDHKRIGILYIGTAGIFFAVSGFLALLIRTQLASHDGSVITGNSYNEVVTMHGTGMVFFVVVPILAGLANYLVPLMIGAPDMAFPRLNALSYWLYGFAGLVFLGSFFASGGAANTGWTAYPPLSLEALGNGQDLWILSIHILTLSSMLGAINFIVTIHNMRTRGMSWMRIPLFVWSVEVYAWLLLLVLPVLSAGLTLLLLERQFPDTFHFFRPEGVDRGGSPILFQHVFWFFGHPEVYIMVLPAFGIVSEVLPVFARKPIFGYKAVAASTAAIAFLSMAPVDIQLQDTYYVIAHFHYVLVAGSLFALFAGYYYWAPKWTGVMYNETLGKVHFWVSMVSFNVTFFPMHFLGLAGMPRRYADYPMQFADFNMLASASAFVFGLAQVFFFVAVVVPMMRGRGAPAPQRPWDGAEGLEWEVPSPAPFHTFEHPPKLDRTATRVIG